MVDFISEARLGDLAFFQDGDGRINHVGLVLDDLHILHCYGEVRIDLLDHFGVFHGSMKKYTHQLRYIKRVIHPDETSQLI